MRLSPAHGSPVAGSRSRSSCHSGSPNAPPPTVPADLPPFALYQAFPAPTTTAAPSPCGSRRLGDPVFPGVRRPSAVRCPCMTLPASSNLAKCPSRGWGASVPGKPNAGRRDRHHANPSTRHRLLAAKQRRNPPKGASADRAIGGQQYSPPAARCDGEVWPHWSVPVGRRKRPASISPVPSRLPHVGRGVRGDVFTRGLGVSGSLALTMRAGLAGLRVHVFRRSRFPTCSGPRWLSPQGRR